MTWSILARDPPSPRNPPPGCRFHTRCASTDPRCRSENPDILDPTVARSFVGRIVFASAIIAEASLSFLGLGQQPPAPSWGSMLNTAQRCIEQAPGRAVFPGLSIFVVVLAFTLVGDGLRDALDPRQR